VIDVASFSAETPLRPATITVEPPFDNLRHASAPMTPAPPITQAIELALTGSCDPQDVGVTLGSCDIAEGDPTAIRARWQDVMGR